MAVGDQFAVQDSATMEMSKGTGGNGATKPSKEYGAVLSSTLDNADEVFETAKKMRKLTGKPIMLIIGGA